MDCTEAKGLIGPALASGLDPERLRALIEHLGLCEICLSEAEIQLLVRQVLTERPDDPLPAGFTTRLSTRLEQEAGRKRRGLWKWAQRVLAPGPRRQKN